VSADESAWRPIAFGAHLPEVGRACASHDGAWIAAPAYWSFQGRRCQSARSVVSSRSIIAL
jgi:hypothetical protein